jgi:hypothetical protein
MIRIKYEGPARGVHHLAHQLRAEGLSVDYEPPVERRGGVGTVVDSVVTYITCKATDELIGETVRAAIKVGIGKFRKSAPGAPVEIEIGEDE